MGLVTGGNFTANRVRSGKRIKTLLQFIKTFRASIYQLLSLCKAAVKCLKYVTHSVLTTTL